MTAEVAAKNSPLDAESAIGPVKSVLRHIALFAQDGGTVTITTMWGTVTLAAVK